MSRVVQGSKFAFETRVLRPFEFASQMSVGETIVTKAVAASVYSGVDATPSAVILASAISGTQVLVTVTAGVVGVVYDILVSASTTGGAQNLQQSCYLAVVPDL